MGVEEYMIGDGNQAADLKFPNVVTEWYDYKGDGVKCVDLAHVVIGPERFAMILRHPIGLHFNGYVLVDESKFKLCEDSLRKIIYPDITYAGPSGKYITWKSRNARGRLNQISQITGSDFWVGFDSNRRMAGAPEVGETITYESALAALYGFENTIWSMLNGRLAV